MEEVSFLVGVTAYSSWLLSWIGLGVAISISGLDGWSHWQHMMINPDPDRYHLRRETFMKGASRQTLSNASNLFSGANFDSETIVSAVCGILDIQRKDSSCTTARI